MNITDYEKELDDIVEGLLSDEMNNAFFRAKTQGLLLKEIALCIAGNTEELTHIGLVLERIVVSIENTP